MGAYGLLTRLNNSTPTKISPKDQKEMLSYSYEIRPDGLYYGKTENNGIVTFSGERMEGVDMKTLEYLGCGYLKDSKNIYNNGLAIKGVDVKTFILISTTASCNYQKDQNNVYYGGSFVVSGADPKTFEVIANNYAKDSKNVYAMRTPIVGADPKTAVFYKSAAGRDNLEECLKDKNGVYIDGEKITNADPSTFIYLVNGYSKDKNSVYYDGGNGNATENSYKPYSPVQGVDLKTFEVIGGSGDYAKDKTNVYSFGKILSGANPKTFKVPVQ